MEQRTAPEGILCAKTHEWILGEEVCTVGLTDYAVEELGDIVFVELPEVGSSYEKGEVFGTIESVKAASEMYMPVGGEIVEINEKIISSPETVNEDNWGEGWLIKIKPSDYAQDSIGLSEYEDYREEIE